MDDIAEQISKPMCADLQSFDTLDGDLKLSSIASLNNIENVTWDDVREATTGELHQLVELIEAGLPEVFVTISVCIATILQAQRQSIYGRRCYYVQ